MRTAVIIGAGMIARTHMLACVAGRHKIRLKGIADGGSGRGAGLAAEASNLLGSEVCRFNSLCDVVDDHEVDFAIVATPPNVRQTVVGPLVAAGRHILLEKPIARNITEASALVSLCREAGVTLGIVFQHRMRAASLKAREMVASGALGALGLCEITVPWWRPQSYYDESDRGSYGRDGGGVMITQAIHMLDLALSLAGPVENVLALTATTPLHRMESEDFVSAGLRFTNGAVGSFVASTASFPGRPEAIALHFEKASLHLAAGVLAVNWRDGRSETFVETHPGSSEADPTRAKELSHKPAVSESGVEMAG